MISARAHTHTHTTCGGGHVNDRKLDEIVHYYYCSQVGSQTNVHNKVNWVMAEMMRDAGIVRGVEVRTDRILPIVTGTRSGDVDEGQT
jgi:hypothetical protein